LAILTLLCCAVTSLLVVATMLPFSDSPRWWVRAADFPRVQVLVMFALTAALGFWLDDPAARTAGVVSLVGMAVQAAYILPYTPVLPREIKAAPPGETADDVRFLAINVKMENDHHAGIAEEIRRSDADVLLLMETDQAWADGLAEVLSTYTTVLRQPQSNHYGMIFATRLAVERAELVRLTADDTPTAFAELRSPGGTVFRFVGLHPVPSVPGEDTETRDAQILYAARYARNGTTPVIAMGDFNTVAWSKVARRFKEGGAFLDPRIGRGLVASFDARYRLLRFPIDQFYLKGPVAMVDFRRGDPVGSDHFPMHAHVRFDAELASRLNRRVKPLPDAKEAVILRRIETYEAMLAAKRGKIPAPRSGAAG
jgi:endonuclease/exonuclease/phosphatase (EEP) superfamily protein YafD